MRFGSRSTPWIVLAGLAVLVVSARSALFRYATGPAAVIGETAVITEVNSGVAFTARVDTGAATSSIHVEPDDVVIVDPAPKPVDNVTKPVRLRLDNGSGEKAWVETRIEDYVEVRSANGSEHRYQVSLPLQCGDVRKVATVNLKDRSDMTFRLLLGRDFLRDDFVVDVARQGTQAL
ncbi:MAG: RimK/LysX family protein [Planctomycetota bacterium]